MIDFPQPAKLINLNDRSHWRVKGALTKAWRTSAYYAAKQAKQGPLGPSYVYVTLPVRTAARRDPHNFVPTVKAIVDGLVDAGVWPDDNSEWVTVVEPQLVRNTNVVVWFEPRAELAQEVR